MEAAALKNKIFRIFALLVLTATAVSACSVRKTSSANKITNYVECSLPKDQGSGSLLAPFSGTAIPVVFDQEFYLSDDGAALTSLRNAVNTWNGWAVLRGLQLFRIVNDGSGVSAGGHIPVSNPATSTPCTQSFYTTESAGRGYVGIWKIQASGDGKNTRDSCAGLGQTKILDDLIQGSTDWIVSGKKITGASILLNFDAWNAPGKVKLDLESLVLHELGHVAGLLHSCNGSTDGGDATSAISCSLAPPSYISAVMFPALLPDQIRRTLGQNDYNRINCLY